MFYRSTGIIYYIYTIDLATCYVSTSNDHNRAPNAPPLRMFCARLINRTIAAFVLWSSQYKVWKTPIATSPT